MLHRILCSLILLFTMSSGAKAATGAAVDPSQAFDVAVKVFSKQSRYLMQNYRLSSIAYVKLGKSIPNIYGQYFVKGKFMTPNASRVLDCTVALDIHLAPPEEVPDNADILETTDEGVFFSIEQRSSCSETTGE